MDYNLELDDSNIFREYGLNIMPFLNKKFGVSKFFNKNGDFSTHVIQSNFSLVDYEKFVKGLEKLFVFKKFSKGSLNVILEDLDIRFFLSSFSIYHHDIIEKHHIGKGSLFYHTEDLLYLLWWFKKLPQ